MVYVTGDTHADLSRFTAGPARRLRKGDTLLVCGDFGFIWRGGRQEERALKKLSRLRYTVAFVDGRHENFDRLARYPVSEWQGGRAQRIADNIVHLMRGEVYTIEGHTFFTFGGGESPDRDMRVPSEGWWPEEMPTAEEMQAGRDRLAARGNCVDYIITHEPSGRIGGYALDRQARMNGVNLYLNSIEEAVSYTCWFFGCLHMDRAVSKRHIAVFRRILPVDSVAASPET